MKTAAIVIAALAGLAQAQDMGTIYKNNCIACHGAAGEGSDKVKSLLKDELFEPSYDKPWFDVIMNGREGLADHAFAAKLREAAGKQKNDKEDPAPPRAWGLVNYIRELQSAEHRNRVGSPKPRDDQFVSKHERFRLEQVVESGLSVPWAVDFLPDGRMISTERGGQIRVSQSGSSVLPAIMSAPAEGTPAVRNRGQGGLMDIAVHPDYAKPGNGWIYLSLSDPSKVTESPQPEASKDADPKAARPKTPNGMTKVVRGRLKQSADKKSWQWVDQQTIFEAKPEHYLPGDIHFGSRIVFSDKIADGPDKGKRYVYFTIGERGHAQMAQDIKRPNGKVHRVFEDGSIPSDNPFVNEPEGTYKSIYSFGHRNPQGLVLGLDGTLWDTEHAPRGGDELNIVEKGKNYGWPLVTFGINYSGEALVVPWPNPEDPQQKDIVMPVYRWMPSIAACGLTVSTGEGFPEWKGDLFAGGLAGATLQRLRIEDGKLVEREELLHGMGRVRDVFAGPGGSIYVVLNDPDRIVRLTPVK